MREKNLSLTEAAVASHDRFAVRLRRVGGQTVDLGRIDTGVSECRDDGLTRQLQFGAAGVLGELGGSDADDGGGSREWADRHQGLSSSLKATATGAGCMVAEAVCTLHLDHDHSVFLGHDLTGHRHGVTRVVGRPETNGDAAQGRCRSGPVRDVSTDKTVAREDVHEDILRATLLGQARIVVHVLKIASGDCRGDDQRAGQRDRQLGQCLSDNDVCVTATGKYGHASTSTPDASCAPRRARSELEPPRVAAICLPHNR